MTTPFLALPAGIALCYLLLVLTLFLAQRRLLFKPDTTRPPLAAGLPGLHEVTLATADGLALLAWYLPPVPEAPVIVFFHGNVGTIGDRAGRLRQFAAAGFGALFPEYRGYGGNPGRPSEAGLLADGRAALDFLDAAGIPPDRVVLYGELLGTGVAVRMAGERRVAALVLEAPYTSMVDAAQAHYPYVPVRWLLEDRFDSLAAIGRVRVPLLLAQGLRDKVVPPALGQRLFAAANQPKLLWQAPDGQHTGLDAHGLAEVAADFVRRSLPAATADERPLAEPVP